MQLDKKNIWILVANGSSGRIFQSKGRCLKLIQEISSESAHLKSRELGVDRPGRVYESANPAHHAVEPKTDPHRKEKTRFAHYLASFLNEGAILKKFDKLVLIASPEFLGDIRGELSKRTYKFVTKEVNKDLTHKNEEEILSYIF